MTEPSHLLTTLRRRRGVSRAAITRLARSLGDLKDATEDPKTFGTAQHAIRRLQAQDQTFHEHHAKIIDLLENEEELEREQETLDAHDEEVSRITVEIEQVMSECPAVVNQSAHKTLSRRITYLQKSLAKVEGDINDLEEGTDDICLLHHHQEQLTDLKEELREVTNNMLALDLRDDDDLMISQTRLRETVSHCSLSLKRLLTPLSSAAARPSTHSPRENPGVKLPKLDVPVFDGSMLGWQSFWEQFCIAVHDRTSISNAEKLVYLQQSLKNGPAQNAIESLSRTGDHYEEAIASLRARYDKPRLIHRGHVTTIINTPCLKGDSGHDLRRLHDTIQQHLRALKSMSYEPSGPFVTSIIEQKLDQNTLFEWQKHSQSSTKVPPYQEILDFISLRAQALETSVKHPKDETRTPRSTLPTRRNIALFATNASDFTTASCIICKSEKHPLYSCSRFKGLSHDEMMSLLKEKRICLNCLRPGHFARQCRSQHKCKKCQRPHHTLLHLDADAHEPAKFEVDLLPSHATMGLASNTLLMTCQVKVHSPNGSIVKARALLDSASSASFVSERLAQSLSLPRSPHSTRITGVAGLTHKSPIQAVTNFVVETSRSPSKEFSVTAVILPRVTCQLPLHPVEIDSSWKHLHGLQMADPHFGRPGKIDLLLGVDLFVTTILGGRRIGPPNTPVALETEFGWVFAGRTNSSPHMDSHVSTHHTSLLSGDNLLSRFWEIEENPGSDTVYTPEEQSVLKHFEDNHSRTESGRFVVPLPRRPDAAPLGESRSQAVRRFISLISKGQFDKFEEVMQEYMDMGHAEIVPVADLEKPPHSVFYLPMHAVRKESSTTTKIRAVFDASAKSATGISLNDTLMVGPTVHPPLIDVLIRFRLHRIALVADVSRMYRAVELTDSDRDFHRFVWRKNPREPLTDHRMTRVTFGVSASSFVANMSVKQNANDLSHKYPLAAVVVNESFYVDDALTDADSVDDAIELQKQLHNLFFDGGFLLRKWNASDPSVLLHVSPELKDPKALHSIPCPEEYTKTLGIEWNSGLDHFRLTVSQSPPSDPVTKRSLISDIAKTYDVLGWFAPIITTTLGTQAGLGRLNTFFSQGPMATVAKRTTTLVRSSYPTVLLP